MKERYHELLKSYCRTEDLKEPPKAGSKSTTNIGTCEWGGNSYACATNGHILLLIPMGLTIGYENDDYPTVAKVMPEPSEGLGKLTMKDIQKVVSGLRMEREYSKKDCPDCDGNGEFMHGNHDYDCQNCDGSGKIKDKFLGMVPAYHQHVAIGETLYQGSLLHMMNTVVAQEGADAEILCLGMYPQSQGDGQGFPLLLKIGNCIVLIMPYQKYLSSGEKYPKIKIKK